MDKLIKISDDKLNEILANHKLWIDSKSKYGNHANLCDADLSGANLRGADLRGANLNDADLSGADLRGADLRGADLRGANLRDADLSGAHLSGATIEKHTLNKHLCAVSRSDGYIFNAFTLKDSDDVLIRAGCRTLTLSEYRDHVKENYFDTAKGRETSLILDFIEARAKG